MTSLRTRWRHFLASPDSAVNRRLWREIRSSHPPFLIAVAADARRCAAHRGDRFEYTSRLDTLLQVLRLIVVTDAFLGQVLYRAKAALQAHRIPLLPRLLQRVIASSCQMFIGDPVVIEPGVHFPHGQVVIDGITVIRSGVVIAPFTTVGLVGGEFGGPTIERGVKIGTGARILGPVTIGRNAEIGANAVVVKDIPANAVAVGVPAEVIRMKTP